MRGMLCGRWLSPCCPARTLAPPTSTPPLARVIITARQPDPNLTQMVASGPHGRQWYLCAVWDLALKAQGLHAALCICFSCPIVVIGDANLPEGQ